MGKAEDYVEKYLKKQTEAAGGLCYKFTSGVNGVPDRIIVLSGHTVFIETKAPKGKNPRRLQLVQHRRIRDCGGEVHVISTREQVDELIDGILSSEEQP